MTIQSIEVQLHSMSIGYLDQISARELESAVKEELQEEYPDTPVKVYHIHSGYHGNVLVNNCIYSEKCDMVSEKVDQIIDSFLSN